MGPVYTQAAAAALNARGDALRTRLNAICRRAGAALQVTGIGSMLAFHARREPIRSPADAAKGDAKVRELLFYDLLAHGIYSMPKRGLHDPHACRFREADLAALEARCRVNSSSTRASLLA